MRIESSPAILARIFRPMAECRAFAALPQVGCGHPCMTQAARQCGVRATATPRKDRLRSGPLLRPFGESLALFARFRQRDRNRLLATLHLAASAARPASRGAALKALHLALDVFAHAWGIFSPPLGHWCLRDRRVLATNNITTSKHACREIVPSPANAALFKRSNRTRHGAEFVGARHRPRDLEPLVAGAGNELARLQWRKKLDKASDFVGRDAPRKMRRHELVRMVEPGRRRELGERFQGGAMKIIDALGLVRNDERALPRAVLGRDAGRAAVGVARLRLDAAECEHEAARRIAPVGAERHDTRDIEGADDLARSAHPDAIARIDADERVVHEVQAFAQ